MKRLVFVMATAVMLMAAPAKQTFTGILTDAMCGTDHASMGVSPDSKCATECARMGSGYALVAGKNVYKLDGGKVPENLAARRVTVTGALDAKTSVIQVESITAAR